MYTGCVATRGQSDLVLCMTICATSHASTIPLSVYISIPVQPAASLHLAASATLSMYISWLTFMDCGAVEKILISVSALLCGVARPSRVSDCIEATSVGVYVWRSITGWSVYWLPTAAHAYFSLARCPRSAARTLSSSRAEDRAGCPVVSQAQPSARL